MSTPPSLESLGYGHLAAPGDAAGRIPVAVLGATGTVGQRFIRLLEDHPWFRAEALLASARSAGKPYREAVDWIQDAPIPVAAAEKTVAEAQASSLGEGENIDHCPLVLSALDASVAGPIEAALAARGHLVVSNARSHRMAPEVPLLVPEVNPDHLELASRQAQKTGGAIVTNPNCASIGLVLTLAPLVHAFGVKAVSVVSLQAISGAGLPGVASYRIADNVVPYIGGEEEKLEMEPHKILGTLTASGIEPHGATISAQCNRVPVIDGHTLCVSLALGTKASADDVRRAWEEFHALPQELALPSAPRQPVHVLNELAAPQPRLHRELEGGMAASVGRLRACPLLDFRYVTLSHNTLRGAAGGALLAAELAVARGVLGEVGLGAVREATPT